MVYSIFWPLNEEFEKSKALILLKATDPTSLLYNGPFLLKGLTAKSSIEFAKNEQYWDKENVHLDTATLAYFDGSDQESLERNFTSGAYSFARSTNKFKLLKGRGSHTRIIFSTLRQELVIGGLGVNIDRQNYKYTSKTTDEEKNIY